MKILLTALLVLFGCRNPRSEVVCEQDGKETLRVLGALRTYKGSVKIYANDGRFIVPSSTWTCTETAYEVR